MTYSEFKKLSKAQQLYAIESGEAVMSESRPMNPAWLRLEGQDDLTIVSGETISSELPKLPFNFLASEIEALLPDHPEGLAIFRDPHKPVGKTVHQWLLDREEHDPHGVPEFEDDEAKEAACASNSIWACYYHSPVCDRLISLGAPTLAGLLEQLNFWATDGN